MKTTSSEGPPCIAFNYTAHISWWPEERSVSPPAGWICYSGYQEWLRAEYKSLPTSKLLFTLTDHQLTFTTIQVNLIGWSFKLSWLVLRMGVAGGGSRLPVESQLFRTDRPSQVSQNPSNKRAFALEYKTKKNSQHIQILLGALLSAEGKDNILPPWWKLRCSVKMPKCLSKVVIIDNI